jgi:excinuclease ABC subunit A
VLHELADNGNTVLVIEHNLDVIKTADWILDLGPEGGDGGGRIVAQGAPDEVAKIKTSYTGQYLAQALKRHAERAGAPAKPKLKAAAAEASAPKATKKNGKKTATG